MAETRVRLLTKSGYNESFEGPLVPLGRDKGIIFPYTPVISYSNTTNYSQYDLVHTNYTINSFVNSRPGNISITAPFINQTENEAAYTFGVIHFLRVVTKMEFGKGSNLGTPPPVLEFSAYGKNNFNRIPVLVGNFSTTYPNDVDYVSFSSNGENTKLPVMMEITIELIPQYSATKQNNFGLSTFSNGESYKRGFGYI